MPDTQRDMMRALVREHGANEEAVVSAYAQAERDGKVRREKNDSDLDAEQYARALYRDGVKKGWF